MHALAERVLKYVRQKELLSPGDRVGVAVSGGADSVTLLRLLLELRAELGIVLCVVHFNHKLRGEDSDADQAFVEELARQQGIELEVSSADVGAHSSEHGGFEAAARHFRYGFFEKLIITSGRLNKIATGHTLDDQAETVLLRLLRGTGPQGMAAIRPKLDLAGARAIVRPLLQERRRELHGYLQELHQPWREDSTNLDPSFTRNRVRHTLLPILERDFNSEIVTGLAEFAEIADVEEEFWSGMTRCFSLAVKKETDPTGTRSFNVQIKKLFSQPLALRRRLIRELARQVALPLTFAHVESILALASEGTPNRTETSLPLGWRAVRENKDLRLVAPHSARQEHIPASYEYELPIPGRIEIPEARLSFGAGASIFETVPVTPSRLPAGYNPEHLYARHALGSELLVRNWRPGDRFWPAHSKSSKKIKELLQEKKIPAEARARWPVVVSDEEIVWVRGFPAPARFRPDPSHRDAIVIRELLQNERGET